MRQVKVGLVGSGFIAELHMHAYRRVFGIEATVRAVVSRGDHVLVKNYGVPADRCTVRSVEYYGPQSPRD